MAVALTHTTVATGTDAGNAQIGKTQWNETHTLTMATSRLLGRTTAGAGAVEEISAGAGLTLSAGVLDVGSVSLTTGVTGTLPVANGGTGLTAGTSGGVLYYSAAGTLASSAALAANSLLIGGGAGVAPSSITTGTGVVTALGVNTGSAGAFVVNGGALGTPSSGTVTNLTGTASININGTVGATTRNTGAFTTVDASGAIKTSGQAAANQTSAGILDFYTADNATRILSWGSAGVAGKVSFWTGNGGSGTTEKFKVDDSGGTFAGSAAFGTTLSSWDTNLRALQVSTTGSVFAASNVIYLGQNFYSSAGGDLYLATGAASFYSQSAGAHTWSNAASGTAGNAVTFTERMKLDASGNLKIAGLTASKAVFTDASKNLTSTGTLGVDQGGTGLTAGTSGGVLYYSATGTLASSAALAASALVVGGGAGVAPSTVTTGTGVVTALGVNTGTAGAFVVNGGALGTPSSGTVTNLTGTASININGTVGATTPNTGAFTSVTSTSASGILTRAAATQDGVELVGRAGGTTSLKVTFTPTTLTASRTITLPDANINFTTGLGVAQGGTGLTSGTSGGVLYYSATGTLASSAALAANALVVGGGAGAAPSTITTGTGVVTALGVNTGTAGAFVVNGGALGTPSSGTVTNLTGTASININGTVGATTPNTGAFTSVTSTSASGILTRAAATQDGVELIGRAGGTTSLKVTFTPTTLTASRTITLPDATGVAVLDTATQTLTNKTLTDPAIIGAIVEDVFTITDGAAVDIDPGNGTIQLWTLGANRTPTATNFLAGESVTLMILDGTAYTVTWTTIGVTWVGGSPPTLDTTKYTVIELWKVSTTVYGALVGFA